MVGVDVFATGPQQGDQFGGVGEYGFVIWGEPGSDWVRAEIRDLGMHQSWNLVFVDRF